VDQGSGKIYAMDTATVTPGTYFVSQPKPSKGDLPNRADVATLDIHTGVVTDLHTGLISPKGLLFLPKAATTPTSTATPGPTSAPATSTPVDIPTAVPAGSGGLGTPTSPATIRTEIGAALIGLLLLAAGVAGLTRRSLRRH
jgi:hypothetical protein